MATTLDFSEVNNWLNSQPENTASTPYEIIITNAPASGYSSALNVTGRFVSIVGMEMSSGVTSIGTQAFYRCTNLTSITIPNSVTSIDRDAFYYCTSLKTINYTGTEEQWNAISKGTDWNAGTSFNVIYNYKPE